jgi:hypothetical protein
VLCKLFAKGFENIRAGLEEILIEIVFTSFSASQDEITFEIRRFLYAFD